MAKTHNKKTTDQIKMHELMVNFSTLDGRPIWDGHHWNPTLVICRYDSQELEVQKQ